MLPRHVLASLQIVGVRSLADSTGISAFPVSTVVRKAPDDVLNPPKPRTAIKVPGGSAGTLDLSGAPMDLIRSRRVRIFRRAREATQQGWANTKSWKIELDNQERWENPLIGWSSTGDPLSNIAMALDFASKEDAIQYCEKNEFSYEVIEPNERKIEPKTYAENFSWNKRTRITNK